MNKINKFLVFFILFSFLSLTAGLAYYLKIWPFKPTLKTYLPQGEVANFSYDPSSTRFLKEEKTGVKGQVLVFTLMGPDNKVTISQQEDRSREAYKEILRQVDDYEELQTKWGAGILSSWGTSNPRSLVAVHVSGTTIFARSEKSLSVGQWQQIFSSLEPRDN